MGKVKCKKIYRETQRKKSRESNRSEIVEGSWREKERERERELSLIHI